MPEIQSVMPAPSAPAPTAPTPAAPSTPAAPVVSDYYQALNQARADVAKTVDVTPKVELPGAGDKPAETETEETQPSVETEPTDPLEQALHKATRTKRDYSGLSEEEVDIFKSMSNKSYEKLRPQYDQWKALGFDPKKIAELQTEAEDLRKYRYADHPDAYKLSEDYTKAQQLSQQIQAINGHWKAQLAALRAGKPVSFITRDAQGRFIPTQPIDPTPEVEVAIIENLTKTSSDFQIANRELELLSEEYRGNHAEYGKTIGKIHADMFGKYEAALKPKAEEYLNKFPAFVRHKPEVRFAAYAIAALVTGSNGKTAAANAEVANKAVAAAAQAAGPSASTIKTGAAKPANTTSDAEYADFKSRFHLK